LVSRGSEVHVHDPAVPELPDDLAVVARHADAVDAARGVSALVVATEWPEYRRVEADVLAGAFPSGLVLDANRFLRDSLGRDPRFRLVSVGQPAS
jgi:UDP-N-acetyl-D-mannosaminuronate dehydrogenase